MKRIFFLFSFILLSFSAMAAEETQDQRPRFNPAEFVARMESFITQRACFTKEEAERFYPIFHEMKGKQRELNRKAQWLKRKGPQEAGDKAYAETIAKITALEIRVAELSESYYKKMCKEVPAQKVWKAMQADDDFTRDMLNEFHRGREQHGKDRNNRR